MARILIAAALTVAGVMLVTGLLLTLTREPGDLDDGTSAPAPERTAAEAVAPPAGPPPRPLPTPVPRAQPTPEPEPAAPPEPAPASVVPVALPAPPPKRARVERPADPGEIHGVVIDQSGAVVVGAGVWIYTGTADRSSTRSDERGTFSFCGLPIGRHRIEVEPGRIDKRGGFAIAGVTVQLMKYAPIARPRIVVVRGLYVNGTVVGPDGKPLVGVPVIAFGSRDDLFGEMGIGAESGRNGRFCLGPLRPGQLMIQADGSEGLADSRPITVNAGMTGVVLRLPRAASLAGTATRAAHEGRISCEIRAYLRSRWVWERAWAGKTHGDFEFPELEPGVYDLVAVDGAGHVGVRHGVSVGEGAKITRVELRLVPGGRLELCIEGRDLGPRLEDTPHKWTVRQHGATVYSARATAGRKRAVVPAGPCRVRLVRLADNVVVDERGVSALPGQSVEIGVPLQ